MAKVKSTGKSIPKNQAPGGMTTALLMMNVLPDPAVVFDFMLKVSFSNKAAQGLFHLSEKQFLGKYMVELLGSKSTVFESLENVVRRDLTVTLHNVSINERPVSSVIISTVERKSSYLMIIRQKPMQLTQKWNEQTMYVLKSTNRLAEDIKKPLAAIASAARLLGHSQLSVRDRGVVEQIAEETARIQELLDKANIFHEVPRSRHRDVSLHDVHDQVIKIARETYGKNIEFSEYFDPSLPDIRGHFDHLVQANLHLIKNAAEAFNNKKGRISIRTFYDAAAGYHPDRDEHLPLCIEIEDNGRGIQKETITRIFQPCFTTKKNSLGLGLPIVSKIVDDHGGVIKVDSAPGKTIFRINLPVPVNPVKK